MQLDDLASETAAFLTTQHPDYGRLAARIAVSNLHKQTLKSFSETMMKMQQTRLLLSLDELRSFDAELTRSRA